jgi:hypothetical protein
MTWERHVRMDDDGHMRRREFLRRHHPDRGGDPAVFVAGLRELDTQAGSFRPRVVAVRHRAWPVTLILTLSRRWNGSHRGRRVR